MICVWAGRTTADRYRNSATKVKRWVAVENKKIIGFCDHNFKCELDGLYIHKDYRGKGIGKKLLKVAEDSMKKLGCKKIKIISTITAKTFYQKNDYKVIKKRSHQIEDKEMKVFIISKNLQ